METGLVDPGRGGYRTVPAACCGVRCRPRPSTSCSACCSGTQSTARRPWKLPSTPGCHRCCSRLCQALQAGLAARPRLTRARPLGSSSRARHRSPRSLWARRATLGNWPRSRGSTMRRVPCHRWSTSLSPAGASPGPRRQTRVATFLVTFARFPQVLLAQGPGMSSQNGQCKTSNATCLTTSKTQGSSSDFFATTFHDFHRFISRIFSDFLGRLQPSETTIQKTLGTPGVVPSGHYYLRSLSRTSRTFSFPDSRDLLEVLSDFLGRE